MTLRGAALGGVDVAYAGGGVPLGFVWGLIEDMWRCGVWRLRARAFSGAKIEGLGSCRQRSIALDELHYHRAAVAGNVRKSPIDGHRTPHTMISRSALTRGTQLALRRQATGKTAQRGFAAAASEHSSYESTNIAGINVASRDDHGPTTRLAIVAKAGTRYQPLPGLTIGLEEFAFKAGIHEQLPARELRS